MKISVKTEKTEASLKDAEVRVGATASGEVCFSVEVKGDPDRKVAMRPGFAVKLYRCFIGEIESAMVSGDTCGMSASYDDLSSTWLFETWHAGVSGCSFCMNSDQVMAVAWALEKAVADALAPEKQGGAMEASPSAVWLLESRTASIHAKTGSAWTPRIDGTEQMYSSRSAAMDDLREFMRPLVNEANSEEYWSEAEKEGRSVDDVLDYIFDNATVRPESDTVEYSYCGDLKVFKVRLKRLEVCR